MMVFRLWKYIERMNEINCMDDAIETLEAGWPQQCDGLTKEQINEKLGYVIDSQWMVEED